MAENFEQLKEEALDNVISVEKDEFKADEALLYMKLVFLTPDEINKKGARPLVDEAPGYLFAGNLANIVVYLQENLASFAEQYSNLISRQLSNDYLNIDIRFMGKSIDSTLVPKTFNQDQVVSIARAKIAPRLANRRVTKEIYHPGEFVNFVVQ